MKIYHDDIQYLKLVFIFEAPELETEHDEAVYEVNS